MKYFLRVLDMCGEELGDPAAEKYDIEVGHLSH